MSSGNGRELPARLTFARDVTRQVQTYLEELKGRDDIPELVRPFLSREGTLLFSNNPRDRGWLGTSRRIRGRILGADQLAIDKVAAPDPGHIPPDIYEEYVAQTSPSDAHVIEVELFTDGSPYVRDEDLVYDYRNEYKILALPDTPPYIVNAGYDFLPGTRDERKGLHHGSEVSRLMRAAQIIGPQIIHYLSDEECTTVLSAIRSAHDDISIGRMENWYDES